MNTALNVAIEVTKNACEHRRKHQGAKQAGYDSMPELTSDSESSSDEANSLIRRARQATASKPDHTCISIPRELRLRRLTLKTLQQAEEDALLCEEDAHQAVADLMAQLTFDDD